MRFRYYNIDLREGFSLKPYEDPGEVRDYEGTGS